MPEPIVVINGDTGSDGAASGSPSSLAAISGTGAKTTSGSGVVDVSADAPNLSSVPVDGTAAMWVETPSGRRWSKVTAKDDAADTITGLQPYEVTATGMRWGVGGKRKTLDSRLTADVAANWEIRIEVPTPPPQLAGLTGADLITIVRQELDDTVEGGDVGRFTDAEILRALNAAQELMCTSYQLIREQLTIVTVSGTREYSLGSRVVAVSSIDKNDFQRHLVAMTKRVLDERSPNWRYVSAEPSVWYIEDDQEIGFYPKPNGAYTYVVDSWMLPSAEITGTSIPAIHRRYHRAIAHLAAAFLAESDVGTPHRVARAPLQRGRFLEYMQGAAMVKHGGKVLKGAPTTGTPVWRLRPTNVS